MQQAAGRRAGQVKQAPLMRRAQAAIADFTFPYLTFVGA
jgi:hypothetical protein